MYPRFAKLNKQQLCRDLYVNGLPDNIRVAILKNDSCKRLDDAVNATILALSFREKSSSSPSHQNKVDPKKSQKTKQVECYECHKMGHFARDCYKRKNKNQINKFSKVVAIREVDSVTAHRLIVPCVIDGHKENFLLDSGSAVCLLPSSRYSPEKCENFPLRSAGGDQVEVMGTRVVKARFKS